LFFRLFLESVYGWNVKSSLNNFLKNYQIKNYFYNFLKNNYKFFDLFLIFFFFKSFLIVSKKFRLGVYLNTNTFFKKAYLIRTNLNGLVFFWNFFKNLFTSVLLFSLIIFFFFISKFTLLNKVTFGWFCGLMLSYWIFSGFVFFFKKYQTGKYTSVVQRFWRRSYILFWLIEGSLFTVFIYLTLNASAESSIMFDNSVVYKTHLYSYRFFIYKILPITFLIGLTYFLILISKWALFSRLALYIVSISVCLTYVVWVEFYQFYHLINYYSGNIWTYDTTDHVWVIDIEPRRTRMLNQYTNLLFLLKFWHIVFIYAFWIFFAIRFFEVRRIRYPSLSANFQNFIILYVFAWIFMYPWLKFYFRKVLDFNYQYFYVTKKNWQFSHFFLDLKWIVLSTASLFSNSVYFLDFTIFVNWYNVFIHINNESIYYYGDKNQYIYTNILNTLR